MVHAAGRGMVRLATHSTFSGPMLCNGSLVVEKPLLCQDTRAHIHEAYRTVPGSDVFVLHPVIGQPGQFNILVEGRARGCPRFLSGSAACNDGVVNLATGDDGSGLQRWIVTWVATPPGNSPPVASPPAANSQFGAAVSAVGQTTTTGVVTLKTLPGAVAYTIIIFPGNITVHGSIPGARAASNTSSGSYVPVPVSNLTPSTAYSAIVQWFLPNGTVTPFSQPVPFVTPATDLSPTFASLLPASPSAADVTIIPPTAGPPPSSYVVRLVPLVGGVPISTTVPAAQPTGAYTSLTVGSLTGGLSYQATAIPIYANGSEGPASAPATVVLPSAGAPSAPPSPGSPSTSPLSPTILSAIATGSTSGSVSVLPPANATTCTATLLPTGRRIDGQVPSNLGVSQPYNIILTGMQAGTVNTVQVQCSGADGSLSPLSNSFVFKLPALGAVYPAIVSLQPLSPSELLVGLQPPASNQTVFHYIVTVARQDGSSLPLNVTLPAQPSGTTVGSISGLNPGTLYTISAVALCSSGGVSDPSPVATFAMPTQLNTGFTIASVSAGLASGSADVSLTSGNGSSGVPFAVAAVPASGRIPVLGVGASSPVTLTGLIGEFFCFYFLNPFEIFEFGLLLESHACQSG